MNRSSREALKKLISKAKKNKHVLLDTDDHDDEPLNKIPELTVKKPIEKRVTKKSEPVKKQGKKPNIKEIVESDIEFNDSDREDQSDQEHSDRSEQEHSDHEDRSDHEDHSDHEDRSEHSDQQDSDLEEQSEQEHSDSEEEYNNSKNFRSKQESKKQVSKKQESKKQEPKKQESKKQESKKQESKKQEPKKQDSKRQESKKQDSKKDNIDMLLSDNDSELELQEDDIPETVNISPYKDNNPERYQDTHQEDEEAPVGDLPTKTILKIIKNFGAQQCAEECVDSIKDVILDVMEDLLEHCKTSEMNTDYLRQKTLVYFKQGEEELLDELLLPQKTFQRFIKGVMEHYKKTIKKDGIYMLQSFCETFMVKCIKGALLILSTGNRVRIHGEDIAIASKILMM